MTTVLNHRNGRARALHRWLCAATCVTASGLHTARLEAQAAIASANNTQSISARSPDSAFVTRAVNEIRQRAASQNPSRAIAQANRAQADANANAVGHPTPLTFSAGLSEAPIGALDQGNLRAEIGRDLRTGARRRAERALADVEVRLADVEISLAERAAAADAFRSAITAAALKRIAGRLNAEDSLLIDAEETIRARFGTGDARYVDVLRVRTERLHVQSERSEVLADERMARAGVGMLANTESRPSMIGLIDTLATKPLEVLWQMLLPDLENERSIDSLVALSPDNQRDAVDELRATAAVELGLIEQRSQLSGYAGVQRIGQANNGPTFGPSVGFTMSLPFTAKRGNQLSAAASAASLYAVREARRLHRATSAYEVTAAVEHYAAQRARLATFDAALLQGVREERESAVSAYRTGELSLTELLDFERAMSRAEIERLRALIDAVDALADLTRGTNDSDSPKHNARSAR